MAQQSETKLDTRVTVLEHGLTGMRSDVQNLRADTDAGFNKVYQKLDSLVAGGAGRQTNWYAVMGFVGAMIACITAVFSLAEWRVGVATGPLAKLPEAVIELRIQIEREKAVSEFREKLRRAEASR